MHSRGHRQEEVRDWSMAKILHGGSGREVSVEGKAIICSHCVGDKHSLAIPEYAGTLSFAKRLAYWWRVKTALLSGRISKYKAGLFLEDFSLLWPGKSLKKGQAQSTFLHHPRWRNRPLLHLLRRPAHRPGGHLRPHCPAFPGRLPQHRQHRHRLRKLQQRQEQPLRG